MSNGIDLENPGPYEAELYAALREIIPRGEDGITPSITVGTISTTEPGTEAEMVLAETSPGQFVLSGTFPTGPQGEQGPAATIALDSVQTGAPGTEVVVTNTGTPGAAILNFTIPAGVKGDDGEAATISIGTVSTLAAGEDVTVSNSGTATDVVLNFGIPQGLKGNQGDQGDQGPVGDEGPQGPAATISIGTVTTGLPGSSASVTNSGTSGAAVFDFTIPAGQNGDGSGDMTAAVYDTNGDGKINAADAADAVPWTGITGKPATFPPDAHTHANATTSVAGFMSSTDKSKLDGVAAGATANATDAQLRDRSTHTGTQAIPTVAGLQTSLDARAPLASPALTGTPTAPTATGGTNTTQIATTAFVAAAIAALIDGAPGAIDTLNELAAALGDDPNFATTVTNALAGKAALSHTHAVTDLSDASANGRSLITAADYAAMRALLGLVIGTNVQAYDSDLAAIAALSTTTFGRSFLALADPAAGRTLLELGTAAQSSAADFLAKANNLSDVTNAATAFANIKQAASTIATGVVELATTSEAQAGTDTVRAVTPAGVAAYVSANAGGGAFILDSTTTLSNNAAADFSISSSWAQTRLVLRNVTPATDNVDVFLRASTDNGATFTVPITSKTYIVSGSFNENSTSSTTGAYIFNAVREVGNAASGGNGISGDLLIYQTPGKFAMATFLGVYGQDANGALTDVVGYAQIETTSAITNVRIVCSSGNLASGKIHKIHLEA